MKMNSVTNNSHDFDRRSGFDRRQKQLQLLSKYWLTGKRTAIRREGDRQKYQSIDRYSAKTLAVILLIVMLSVIDAILTLDLISRGAAELNPVMDYYLAHSPLAFFWVKYCLTWAAIMIILLHKNIYLFNTKIQAKVFFIVFLVPFLLVVQWQIYLIFTY